MIRRGLVPWALAAVTAIGLGTAVAAVGPRFLPDDPIAIDPEPRDATGVKPRAAPSSMGDVASLLPARRTGRVVPRAANVNTIDEVPDSSWFTNRFGARGQAGPGAIDADDGPSGRPFGEAERWTISAGDSRQRLARLEVRDSLGRRHTMIFDATGHAELTTGAAMVSARLLGAAGFHTPPHRLIRLRREQLTFDRDAVINDEIGRRRKMTAADLELLLAGAARRPDGGYRAVVRSRPDGVDLGPFGYAGTRRDDPNDLFPHEHRRELRGLRVFAAWLNHDAATAFGTRDVLVEAGERRVVRHFLVDLDATLGSGSALADRAPAGNEYAWRNRSMLKTVLTLGLSVRPWSKVPYPEQRSVGPFESAFFDPDTWIPPYANPAFDSARADDLFWGARRVAAFSDADVREAVQAGRYSEPAAEALLVETLVARRDKIARAWLNAVVPLVDCALAADGWLTCANAADRADSREPKEDGVGSAGRYRVRWFRFDNEADRLDAVTADPDSTVEPRFAAPAGLLEAAAMVAAEIRGEHPRFPGWATPTTLYFRRTPSGWRTVGIYRMP